MKCSLNKLLSFWKIVRFWLLLCLIFAFTFYIRSFGLQGRIDWIGSGFDEGAFITASFEIYKGAIYYKDVFDNKPPGVFFLTATIFYIFGPKLIYARLLSVVISSLTAILLCFIGFKIANRKVGITAAVLFAIDPHYIHWSKFLMTEQFMEFFSALSVLFFIVGYAKLSRKYFFASGIFIGLAFLMKQPGILIFFSFIIFLLINLQAYSKTNLLKKSVNVCLFLIAGILCVWLPVVFYFTINNAFYDFMYGVFGPLLLYHFVSYGDPFFNLVNTSSVIGFFIITKIIGICGLTATILFFKNRKNLTFLIILWFLTNLIFVLTLRELTFKFSGFSHYLLHLILPLSLLSAIFLEKLVIFIQTQIKEKKLTTSKNNLLSFSFIFLLLLVSTLNLYYINIAFQEKYPRTTLQQEKRIGEYIASITQPSDEILVFGNSIFYYWANRSPATRFYFVSGDYFEDKNFQEIYLTEIKQALKSAKTKLVLIGGVFKEEFQEIEEFKEVLDIINNDFSFIIEFKYKYHDGVFIYYKT